MDLSMKLFNKPTNLDTNNLEIMSLLGKAPKYYDTYVKLAECRCLFLSENFTKNVSAEVSAWLLHYDHEDNEAPIFLYLNSDGGDGAALTNIYDVMHMISAPVSTICAGKCYSAGAFILAAGTKGKRYIYKNAQVMIHGLQASFPLLADDQSDAKTYFKFLNDYNDRLLTLLSKHTGQTFSKIKKDCQNDLFFNAKEAVEYGLADYILT
jgi:ATP-dependent Clp protease protease subunit